MSTEGRVKSSGLPKDIARVAGTLSHPEFPRGDLADLRRGGTRLFTSPGYWRVLLDRVSQSHRLDEEAERRWGVILQAMAIMAPDIHVPKQGLGRVLAGMGQDSLEHRLLRLLRSEGQVLEDQIRLMARLLASYNRAVDWAPLAGLLLFQDDNRKESIRRSIARDYYLYFQAHEGSTVA